MILDDSFYIPIHDEETWQVKEWKKLDKKELEPYKDDIRQFMICRQISFAPLREAINCKGMAWFEENSKVSHTTLANITGVRWVTHLPQLKTIMQICGNLKCPVSRVMTFEGYEILARYEGREAVPGDIYTGRISYRPLRSMLYDFFGHREWKNALKRCFDLIEDGKERRPLTEKEKAAWKKKYGENGTPPEMKDPYSQARMKILRDEPVGLDILYQVCKVLRCTPDCVVEYR